VSETGWADFGQGDPHAIALTQSMGAAKEYPLLSMRPRYELHHAAACAGSHMPKPRSDHLHA
jgi:hypothetical protein